MTVAFPSRRFPARKLLREAVRPISDRPAWNRLLQGLHPLWALDQARARIVGRVEESDDTFSLWLRPNRHWKGHRPGQHAALGVEIDGVQRQRVFSLSVADKARKTLRVTIRRQPGQGVTDWLYRHAGVGQVVDLSPAGGEFVLPDPVPERLLMIAAGSGITPMMAMLYDLAERRFSGDIVLLQLCRKTDQRLFDDELAALATRLPGLKTIIHASAVDGRLAAASLPRIVPDLADRHSLLCGPTAFMRDVEAVWANLGCLGRLQREHFAPPRPPFAASTQRRILALESEQAFTQNSNLTLLESAEAAGLTPKFGCRAGLCRTCLCKKQSGRVRNLVTGLVSTQPDEWVQLCVSVAESDLELSL
ncbi:MAG: ferredoxin reductase [Wenzhouxiangellaceae bacterium]|nr:ferredoxin reductase [Wenzhouxiangellaceae bacterium]